MAHCLVVGMTGAGKTTWARKKAHSLQRAGRPCLILDPFKRASWIVDPDLCFVTNDENLFLEAVWKNKECSIFIDESGDMVGRYNNAINSIATKARNFGHKVYFIMQRTKQISVTIRAQCSELVVFRSSLNDTRDLANEFVQEKINEAHNLKTGEFILVRKDRNPEIFNIFNL